MTRLKSIATNTLILFIVTFLMLVASEYLLRSFMPHKWYKTELPRYYYMPDDELGFDIKNNIEFAKQDIIDGKSFKV